MEEILKYFPGLSEMQIAWLRQLKDEYAWWNERINVISRKDIEHLYVRHVLHSMAIGKLISFSPGSKILDVGTGGGFPGIPLAILFPESEFTLADSIGKKIKVVNHIIEKLRLTNVKAMHTRAETIQSTFDFIVSRAVTQLGPFCLWVKDKISTRQQNTIQNGILYLKGGDLDEELKMIASPFQIFNITDFFNDPFFEGKKIIYLPHPVRTKIL